MKHRHCLLFALYTYSGIDAADALAVLRSRVVLALHTALVWHAEVVACLLVAVLVPRRPRPLRLTRTPAVEPIASPCPMPIAPEVEPCLSLSLPAASVVPRVPASAGYSAEAVGIARSAERSLGFLSGVNLAPASPPPDDALPWPPDADCNGYKDEEDAQHKATVENDALTETQLAILEHAQRTTVLSDPNLGKSRNRRPPGPRRPPKPKPRPADPLANVTVAELRTRAAAQGIRGSRTMRRAELVAAVRMEAVA